MQLTSFEVAKDAWDFLSKRYTQINFAQRYKLEQDIRSMKQLHDQSISVFHSEMSLIWNQLTLMEPIWTVDLELWQKYREETRLVQFLMALRDEFESVRASVLHRSPLPTVEVALSELIIEETRKRITPEISGVFVVPSRSIPNNFPRNSNAQVQRDMSQVQCHNCKTFGHLAGNCNFPSANTSPAASIPDTPTTQYGYCKEFGHSSRFCTSPTSINMRRINTNGGNKFNTPTRFTAAPVSSATDPYATSTTSSALVVPGGGSTPNLVDIKEMIKQALSIGNNPTAASAFSISSGIYSTEWFLDSGASNHMTFNQKFFESLHPVITPKIHTADGSTITASHIGLVNNSNNFYVPDVLLVPNIAMNLISVGQLCDQGYNTYCFPFGCAIQDLKTGKLVGIGRRVGWLYLLQSLALSAESKSHVVAATPTAPVSIYPFMSWHSRLGHVSFSRLSYMINKGLLGDTRLDKEPNCISCRLAKQPALSFNLSTSVSTEPFALIHSDVWGKSPIMSKGGALYYVSFIDDYSRYTWVYLFSSRADFLKLYVDFSTMIKTQFGKVIKVFRADQGEEYISNPFKEFLKTQGTILQLSCSETPEQNGVVERKHRHIIETSRTQLISGSVPSNLWENQSLLQSTPSIESQQLS